MDGYLGWAFWLTWIVVFLGSWIYCIAEYGYLLGVGLGWLPSAIVATVAGLLWPVVFLGVAAILYMALKG